MIIKKDLHTVIDGITSCKGTLVQITKENLNYLYDEREVVILESQVDAAAPNRMSKVVEEFDNDMNNDMKWCTGEFTSAVFFIECCSDAMFQTDELKLLYDRLPDCKKILWGLSTAYAPILRTFVILSRK